MATQKQRRNYSSQCDVLFSRLVRARGACQIATDTPCLGVLQACHGFSRRYRATRWDLENAWAGCARHHQWWTAHPIEWDDWMKQTLGERYWVLRSAALWGERPDFKDLLPALKAKAVLVAASHCSN